MSPFALVRSIDTHITSLILRFDIDAMPTAERELLRAIKRTVTDLRLDIRDYGMAESKAAQDKLASAARERLQAFEQAIIKAGSFDFIGAVDVAHLSAQTQQLLAAL